MVALRILMLRGDNKNGSSYTQCIKEKQQMENADH